MRQNLGATRQDRITPPRPSRFDEAHSTRSDPLWSGLSRNVAARRKHSGGVDSRMADGGVRFIKDTLTECFLGRASYARDPRAGLSPVQITSVRILQNKEHLATEVIVDLSGDVNASEVVSPAIDELTIAGKKNSFDAANAKHLSLGAITETRRSTR